MAAPQDPRSWPALLHRLVTSWPALLRLLLGLLIVAAILVGALRLVGDVTLEIGPIGVHHRVEPLPALGHRDPVEVGGDRDLAGEHLGGLPVERLRVAVALGEVGQHELAHAALGGDPGRL